MIDYQPKFSPMFDKIESRDYLLILYMILTLVKQTTINLYHKISIILSKSNDFYGNIYILCTGRPVKHGMFL